MIRRDGLEIRHERSPSIRLEPLEARTLFATTIFTIDPARSDIRLSGEAVNLGLDEQSDGSLKARYDGFIVTDLQGDSIKFLGGSGVAAESRGSFHPGNAPANYAAEFNGPLGINLGDAAVRGLSLDVTSGVLTLGPGGTFASSGQTVLATGGRFEYDVDVFGGGDGDFNLAGNDEANKTSTASTVVTADGVTTLTLPVDVTYNYDSDDAGVDIDAELRLRGKIVATAGADRGVGPRVDLNGSAAGTAYAALFATGGDAAPVPAAAPDGLTVADFDDDTVRSGAVTLQNRRDGAAEVLSVDTAGTAIDADYDTATGVLTLGGTASIADYQKVLRTLTYDNAAADPTLGDRTVRVVLNDGDQDGAPAVSTVSVEEPFSANTIRIGAGQKKSVSFNDADGTLTVLTLKGGGVATVRFQGATDQTDTRGAVFVVGSGVRLVSVDVTNPQPISKLAARIVGGSDNAITVDRITSDGGLSALGGRGLNLRGTLSVIGRVGKAAFGNLNGATVTAGSILKMTATGMQDSTLTITDAFAPLLPTLGSLAVTGPITGSRISAAGNIGSVKASALVDSEIYAGVNSPGAERFPDGADGEFPNEAGALKVTIGGGSGGATFDNSVVAARRLGVLKLGRVDTNNAAAPFGVTADSISSLAAGNATGQKLKLKTLDDPAVLASLLASQNFDLGDFQIRLL